MSSLPPVPLPTDTVNVAGVDVPVRGLSRSESLHITQMNGDIDAAETYLLARGAGVSEEDAKAWRDSAPADAVGAVVDRIVELSGLTEGAQKSG